MLLKNENYENLSKNLTLKFDEENSIRCFNRLDNGNKYNHPIILSKNRELTKLIQSNLSIADISNSGHAMNSGQNVKSQM